jgi:flagella basal body P-ring formation protein FlgA
MADLEGRRMKRSLAAGEVIANDYLEETPAIYRGEETTLALASGSLRLSLTARALEDGCAGETIRFRNPLTRETIEARVVSAGLAELSLATATTVPRSGPSHQGR